MPFNCFGFELCWFYECSKCEQIISLKTNLYAEEWLRNAARDPLTMIRLRTLASQCGYGHLNLLDNHAIIKLIGGLLSSGQVRVCGREKSVERSTATTSAPDKGPEPKAFPLVARQERPAQPLTQKLAEPATFSDHLDGKAQASALASAAAQGVPFCPE